jgi:DNA polymerase-3 subunit alpha
MDQKNFNVGDLEYTDQQTWDLICDGRTKGVYQLESNLGKSWAKRVRPKNIEELAALVALIRPGCLKAIVDGKSMTQHYVDRKHGQAEITYVHESLEPILKSTQGVLVYQEQSMEIAQKIAGFNLEEADNLRKAIGKKQADLMAQIKKKFIKGAADESIVSKEAAEEIFGWIEKSSRYAFNKSHAVSYAICGYWSAYAKAHYPLEFYSNYLKHAKNKPDPQQEVRELVSDAKLSEINVQPPSIDKLNEETEIIHNKIHFGLRDLKSIGTNQINKLKLALSEYDPEDIEISDYSTDLSSWTWYEFLVRLSHKINSSTMTAMLSVGMFSHSKISRNKMLDEFDTWEKLTAKERDWVSSKSTKWDTLVDAMRSLSPRKKEGGGTFNEARSQTVRDLILHLENPAYSLDDTPDWVAQTEQQYLGVPITYSKVDSCDTSSANTTCKEFVDGGRKSAALAVSINAVRKYTIKKGKMKGEDMAFLEVEDHSSPLDNVVIFPENLEKYKSLLYEGNTVLLSGNRSKKEGQRNNDSLIIERVRQI